MNTQEKYKAALEEVLENLKDIDSPNVADSYIDASVEIIEDVLREAE